MNQRYGKYVFLEKNNRSVFSFKINKKSIYFIDNKKQELFR